MNINMRETEHHDEKYALDAWFNRYIHKMVDDLFLIRKFPFFVQIDVFLIGSEIYITLTCCKTELLVNIRDGNDIVGNGGLSENSRIIMSMSTWAHFCYKI